MKDCFCNPNEPLNKTRQLELTIRIPIAFPRTMDDEDLAHDLEQYFGRPSGISYLLQKSIAYFGDERHLLGVRVLLNEKGGKTVYSRPPVWKKNSIFGDSFCCPNCDIPVTRKEDVNYCGTCGQPLLW